MRDEKQQKKPYRTGNGGNRSDSRGSRTKRTGEFKGYNNSYTRPPRRETPRTQDAAEENVSLLSAEDTDAQTLSPANDETNGAVVGRNAVRELLKAGRTVDKIFVRRGEREGSITMLVAMALEQKIPVIEVEKQKLDTLACGLPHQGIVAMAAQKEYCSVDDLLKIAGERGEPPLLVIADDVNDPNNLGAMIRCAEGAGAHGVIIPKRHATGISPAVTRASAGAVEHIAVAKVTNLAQTIEYLKEKGIWTYAAEADGKPYYETDFAGPCALVFGSEGEGVSRLVRERCDFVVSIPMYGQVNSLNVSTAAAVIINEAKRAQTAKYGK